jgi:hypothetical protein
MANWMKAALAAAGAATLLAGCATDPYYNNGYGYNGGYGYNNGYDYGAGPAYYEPGYVGPSVGLGIGFSSYDDGGRREWHGDRDHRGDWHGDRGNHDWHGDRGNHDWHGDRGDRGDGHGGGDHGGHGGDDHGEHSGG